MSYSRLTQSFNKPLIGLLREDHAKLLDVTDRLRDLGLDRHLPLPQLVVCGDQSSGKSSVLESISGVKFPVNEGLCTRFATKVVLRRSAAEAGSVSIEPGESASDEQKRDLEGFNVSNVKFEDIPRLMDDAKMIMCPPGESNFSDSTLRVELSGPKQPHLTLVDLPGLFHVTDKSQAPGDKKLVERMIRNYMAGERTIILVILSAQTDTNNQTILNLAQEMDQGGKRTMGIITKPDFLSRCPGSEKERKFLDYARNREAYFHYGWHVVRNADYLENKDQTFNRRLREDEIFSKPPWNQLDSDSLGAEALVRKLSECSFNLMRRELPNVILEIKSRVNDSRKHLETLGAPREDTETRKDYLTHKAQIFQYLVRDSVAGNYGSDEFLERPSNRLRVHVRKLYDAFASDMRRCGRTYRIDTTEPTSGSHSRSSSHDEDAIPITIGDYLEMIRNEVEIGRGQELPGTFHPNLVGSIFRIQSRRWKDIAQRFADEVYLAVEAFIQTVVYHHTEELTAEKLMDAVIDPAMSLKQEALRLKVEELLTPYTWSQPFPESTRYIEETLRIPQIPKHGHSSDRDVKDVTELRTCQMLVQQEQAYYNVALDTFIANMATLAIENCLLRDLHEILSWTRVSRMSDDEVERLASESPNTVATRKLVRNDLEIYEQSLRICRSCGTGATVAANSPPRNFQSTSAKHRPGTAAHDQATDFPSSARSPANVSAPEIKLSEEESLESEHSDIVSAGQSRGSMGSIQVEAIGQDRPTTPQPSLSKRRTPSPTQFDNGAHTRTPSLTASPGGTPSPANSSPSSSSFGSMSASPGMKRRQRLSVSKLANVPPPSCESGTEDEL